MPRARIACWVAGSLLSPGVAVAAAPAGSGPTPGSSETGDFLRRGLFAVPSWVLWLLAGAITAAAAVALANLALRSKSR